MLFRKRVLKIYSKFKGEHQCRSVISIKLLRELYWDHTSSWGFSFKFTAYFQNTFPKKTPRRLLLKCDSAKLLASLSIPLRKIQSTYYLYLQNSLKLIFTRWSKVKKDFTPLRLKFEIYCLCHYFIIETINDLFKTKNFRSSFCSYNFHYLLVSSKTIFKALWGRVVIIKFQFSNYNTSSDLFLTHKKLKYAKN